MVRAYDQTGVFLPQTRSRSGKAPFYFEPVLNTSRRLVVLPSAKVIAVGGDPKLVFTMCV